MKKGNFVFNRVFTVLVFLFLYAPILLLIVFSFNKGNSNIVWSGFSLDWYRKLFSDRLIMQSVYTTLLVSLLATAIATFAGTFAAIGFHALRRRSRNVLTTVNNIPMMNADIVTGVAMCLFFVAFFGLWTDFAVWFNGIQDVIELPTRLTLGFGTLLIAHVSFNIPYVILSVSPKLRQMDKNLVDAAMDLGCTWMQAFWKVILPEIKPGIISGALTAFTMSVDDFIISYFTAGSSSSTLAMTIYGMTKKRVTPEINAISTLLFFTVLLLLVIVNVREARLERLGKQQPAVRRSPTVEKLSAALSTPRGKWVRWGGTASLACIFVAAVALLTGATNAQPVVNVCSWGEYIDESLITQFEEETGIIVNYQTAESNEALYSLLKSGAGDYDVVTPSDYMISQLIEEDMLEELDYSNIPNFQLIDDRFKNLPYDPENKYTVPYAWGTVGIIYNTTMIEEPITSWSAMFDTQYAGNVLMFRNSRDAMATALLYLGYSLNTTDEGELREAFQLLADAKKNGVYQSFVMDEIYQKLEGGNAAIGAYYAGDYLTMLENNEDLAFVVPEEGSNWFMDAMCVLKDAPHKAEAEAWINFIASTDASLANMDYIWYASPNKEALEQYPAYYEEEYDEPLDPEIYEIMAAPAEVLDQCEAYLVLPAETRRLYNTLWTELGI
ncbi:extracellular solute-binding protein [uncultured Dysosmobacter sp.]|uniref:extracellular solute-binding protein n=1 Tax=uncultured Dysosmobacter sp. TaxID=2591384 RepID=UPI00260F9DBC|nr:extracellular solute-binding protein [uncultured Dysosmobacter sp.]